MKRKISFISQTARDARAVMVGGGRPNSTEADYFSFLQSQFTSFYKKAEISLADRHEMGRILLDQLRLVRNIAKKNVEEGREEGTELAHPLYNNIRFFFGKGGVNQRFDDADVFKGWCQEQVNQIFRNGWPILFPFNHKELNKIGPDRTNLLVRRSGADQSHYTFWRHKDVGRCGGVFVIQKDDFLGEPLLLKDYDATSGKKFQNIHKAFNEHIASRLAYFLLEDSGAPSTSLCYFKKNNTEQLMDSRAEGDRDEAVFLSSKFIAGFETLGDKRRREKGEHDHRYVERAFADNQRLFDYVAVCLLLGNHDVNEDNLGNGIIDLGEALEFENDPLSLIKKICEQSYAPELFLHPRFIGAIKSRVRYIEAELKNSNSEYINTIHQVICNAWNDCEDVILQFNDMDRPIIRDKYKNFLGGSDGDLHEIISQRFFDNAVKLQEFVLHLEVLLYLSEGKYDELRSWLRQNPTIKTVKWFQPKQGSHNLDIVEYKLKDILASANKMGSMRGTFAISSSDEENSSPLSSSGSISPNDSSDEEPTLPKVVTPRAATPRRPFVWTKASTQGLLNVEKKAMIGNKRDAEQLLERLVHRHSVMTHASPDGAVYGIKNVDMGSVKGEPGSPGVLPGMPHYAGDVSVPSPALGTIPHRPQQLLQPHPGHVNTEKDLDKYSSNPLNAKGKMFVGAGATVGASCAILLLILNPPLGMALVAVELLAGGAVYGGFKLKQANRDQEAADPSKTAKQPGSQPLSPYPDITRSCSYVARVSGERDITQPYRSGTICSY